MPPQVPSPREPKATHLEEEAFHRPFFDLRSKTCALKGPDPEPCNGGTDSPEGKYQAV